MGTTGGINRQQFLRLLFIVYFIVVATSPLSRTVAPQFAQEEYSSGAPHPSAENLHVYLWDVVFSRLIHCHGNDGAHTDNGNRVFARGARAIVDEDPDEKNVSPDNAALHEPESLSPAHTPSQCAPENESRRIADATRSLYSGPSPPFKHHQA
ncbi:MAG: hypothetical protein M0024_12600 [Nitrospiraceae bacterium]|nr:hypothetical protein [Nitrospiraceae bacterium]